MKNMLPIETEREFEILSVILERPLFIYEIVEETEIPWETSYRVVNKLESRGVIVKRHPVQRNGELYINPEVDCPYGELKKLSEKQSDYFNRKAGGPRPKLIVITPEYRAIAQNHQESVELALEAMKKYR